MENLQWRNWSQKILLQMRERRVDSANTTIAYHENFCEMALIFEQLHRLGLEKFTPRP
ncbi:hypothetical protein ACERZ8_10045 [Tateyamaria armeniaca]|uniref:Integrase n=1 Tax=Tateyamaria armeniaca TaxID=2518930 RepID=A0ABW8UTF2_9RHOB